MTTKAEELAREALSPPAGQRAEWAEEICRRVDALEAGEARTEPWEIVRQRIENKLGR